MTISQLLLPEFDQEMAATRKLLACVPDEKLAFQPHEKSMTLARLAGHVAELPHWAAVAVQTDFHEIIPGQKPFIAGSKTDLMDTFEKNAAEARASGGRVVAHYGRAEGDDFTSVYGGANRGFEPSDSPPCATGCLPAAESCGHSGNVRSLCRRQVAGISARLNRRALLWEGCYREILS